MKRFFEEGGNNEFNQYQSLGISPIQIHRSKAEHKHAIFVLGREIASVMSEDDFSGPGRTSVRMQQLADRAITEMAR